MKVVVVGGVAGGASAAARVRRLDAKAEIKVFEKGQYVSFSNCSLPYYLSSVVEESEDLIMMDPEEFKTKHDIDVATLSEVTDIIAIAEMTPGPLGVNAATFAGMRSAGVLGALAANLGAMTPSLTVCLLASVFLARVKGNPILDRLMFGIRPVCIGMMTESR